MQQYQHEVKSRFRQGRGFLTREEMRRIAGPAFAMTADKVSDKMEAMQAGHPSPPPGNSL